MNYHIVQAVFSAPGMALGVLGTLTKSPSPLAWLGIMGSILAIGLAALGLAVMQK